MWIAFLGAAIAAKIGRHIKIDITHRLLPKKFGKIILIFTLLFASYICYELMLASNDFVFTIIDPKEILFLQIPTQSFIIIIPIGYGIILFRFLLNAIFLSNEIKNNNWEVEENYKLIKIFLIVILLFLGAPLFTIIGAFALLGFSSIDTPSVAIIAELYRLASQPVLVAIPLLLLPVT